MEQGRLRFTTAQFAKMHHLNKRTLHYYDEIGLFSPMYKGENGYRYYDYMQSMELENIRMLKELHMSIEEIKLYMENPDSKAFLKIAEEKAEEIDAEIRRLKNVKYVLEQKKKQLLECEQMKDLEVKVVEREEEYVLMTPLKISQYHMETLMPHLNQVWELEQYKVGCGSYISLDKVRNHDLSEYDGIYTPVRKKKRGFQLDKLPAGRYLCGYMVGNFYNPMPLYQKMFQFAEQEGLQLVGYAFEIGLNEFTVKEESEYVTKITIRIEE